MTPPSSSPPSCRTAVAHARTGGYVIKGRLRVKYADHEEVLSAGEVYYLAPGHIPVVEEPLEIVEFSPSADYEKTIAALTA